MRSLIAAVAIAAFGNVATAQVYPSRPITMIVPFPPGGPTDTIARIITEQMRASLGVPVILENVGGAGGSIGVGRVARATPDGYTIGIGNSSPMSSTARSTRCRMTSSRISRRSRCCRRSRP